MLVVTLPVIVQNKIEYSEICNCVIQTTAKFSATVDESTCVSNAQSLIVMMYDGVLCAYFLGLLPAASATAAGIEGILTEFLVKQCLNNDIM